jgi:hypothetical protein
MGNKGHGLFQRHAILIVETSQTGPKNQGSHEGSDTTRKVDCTATGQIDSTATPQWLRGKLGQEPVGTPVGVSDDGVHKASQEGRVQQIGLHLSTFGNSPRDDRRQGAGKSELEEPERQVNTTFGAHEESCMRRNVPLAYVSRRHRITSPSPSPSRWGRIYGKHRNS